MLSREDELHGLHVMYLTNDLIPQSLPSFCGVASASGIVPRLQEGSTACGLEMFIWSS